MVLARLFGHIACLVIQDCDFSGFLVDVDSIDSTVDDHLAVIQFPQDAIRTLDVEFDMLNFPALSCPLSLMLGEFQEPEFGLFDLHDQRRWQNGTKVVFDPGIEFGDQPIGNCLCVGRLGHG